MVGVQHLPDEIIQEILLRLPPRSIGRCLAVCKDWHSVVSASIFHHALADRPAAVAKVTATWAWFLHDDDGTGAGFPAERFLRAVVLFDSFRGNVHKTPPSPRGIMFSLPEVLSTTVLGSWDGVVCVERGAYLRGLLRLDWHWDDASTRLREYVLWNPLTRACATVSSPPGRGAIIGGYAHPATMRFHLLHATGEATSLQHPGLFVATSFQLQRVGDGAWREVPLLEEHEYNHADMQVQRSRRTISFRIRGARSVSLHGNLHWMVQRGSTAGQLHVLVFDTARERFRLMEAPSYRRGEKDLARSRIFALSGGKLCAMAVAPATSTMELWVLDDYSSARSWRLMEKISLVMWDKRDLSKTFTSMTQVTAVHGDVDGEEVILHNDGHIDAYSLRRRAWSMVSIPRYAALLEHRESVVQHDVSFGEASRRLQLTVDIDGHFSFGDVF